MTTQEELAGRFEPHRAQLRRIAYRILGSYAEADDAVQECWLRLARFDRESAGRESSNIREVANLGAWLTTVVSRLCLDQLRARAVRREEAGEPEELVAGGGLDTSSVASGLADPERAALLADSLGEALLLVLARLSPAERVAFVLHDLFDLSFDEIAPIVDRTAAAARQLASRGRRALRAAAAAPSPSPTSTPPAPPDRARQREVVLAFHAASRAGDFAGLLALLDPAVVLRADAAGVRMGSAAETRGAEAVARTFSGRAQGAEAALLDGWAGLVWRMAGRLKVAFRFTVTGGRVTALELLADEATLAALEVAPVAVGGEA